MTDQPPGPTHLDLDTLADLLAGEGSPAQVDHVAGCAGCAGRLDELAAAEVEVAAVLAALPAPAVPAGLADRLSAALAAEPALEPVPVPAELLAPVAEHPAERPPGGTGSATVTPFPAARRRRSWVPAAAAAAVLLAGGTLGGAALLSGSGAGDEATDTSAAGGSAESAADPLAGLTVNETGTDYAPDGTLATALPGLLSGSGAAGTAAAPPAPAATDEAPVQEDAPPASLDAQARVAAPGPDRLRDPEALASCLAAVLPPDDDAVRPLALDYAAYGGTPALVVVLPAQDAPDKVDVFVVGPGCALGNDETLFFTRLDRP